MRSLLTLLVALSAGSACAGTDDTALSSSEADLSTSTSDQACGVVFRSALVNGAKFAETGTIIDSWTILVDVASARVTPDASVGVKVRTFDSPFDPRPPFLIRRGGVKVEGAPAGFQRFSIPLAPADLGLPPLIEPSRHLELVAFLEIGQTMLHDHNATHENITGFAGGIFPDPKICPGGPVEKPGRSDTSCNIVLRSAFPAPGPNGQLVDDRFLVWKGVIDVSPAAEKAGAVPMVSWIGKLGERRTFKADRGSGGEGGLHRYTFRLVSDITAESPTAGSESLSLIPFLQFPSGDRVFDHNTRHDDYTLNFGNHHRVDNTGKFCK